MYVGFWLVFTLFDKKEEAVTMQTYFLEDQYHDISTKFTLALNTFDKYFSTLLMFKLTYI